MIKKLYKKHSLVECVVSPTVKAVTETPPTRRSGSALFDHNFSLKSVHLYITPPLPPPPLPVYKNKSEHSDISGSVESLCCHVSDDDQVHRAREGLQEGHGVPVIDVNKVVSIRLRQKRDS